MTASMLAAQFDYNGRTVEINLDGISHEQSLIQPSPGGNCINWIVGHITATRNDVHRLLGLPPAWTGDEPARYARGSEPITTPAEAASLDALLNLYRSSHKRVIEALKAVTVDDLTRTVGKEPAAILLAGLSFHESYHAGQLGILRRLTGRAGAIT
jgi:hypothetical protein